MHTRGAPGCCLYWVEGWQSMAMVSMGHDEAAVSWTSAPSGCGVDGDAVKAGEVISIGSVAIAVPG